MHCTSRWERGQVEVGPFLSPSWPHRLTDGWCKPLESVRALLLFDPSRHRGSDKARWGYTSREGDDTKRGDDLPVDVIQVACHPQVAPPKFPQSKPWHTGNPRSWEKPPKVGGRAAPSLVPANFDKRVGDCVRSVDLPSDRWRALASGTSLANLMAYAHKKVQRWEMSAGDSNLSCSYSGVFCR